MSEWLPVDPAGRRVNGFSPWDLIIILDLGLLALALLAGLILGPAGAEAQTALDPRVALVAYWFDVVLGLVLLGVLPVVWLLTTRVEPVEGTLRFLRLRTDSRHSAWFWFGIASFVAVAMYAALLLFAWVLHATGTDPGGDPVFEQMARLGGWPLVVAISIGAGVGEEILFRGVLQRWVGVWGQAAVFALLHINQGWIAVAFIFAIAFLLGMLLRRGMPLWALMFAHACYDLILLGQLRIAGG